MKKINISNETTRTYKYDRSIELTISNLNLLIEKDHGHTLIDKFGAAYDVPLGFHTIIIRTDTSTKIIKE